MQINICCSVGTYFITNILLVSVGKTCAELRWWPHLFIVQGRRHALDKHHRSLFEQELCRKLSVSLLPVQIPSLSSTGADLSFKLLFRNTWNHMNDCWMELTALTNEERTHPCSKRTGLTSRLSPTPDGMVMQHVGRLSYNLDLPFRISYSCMWSSLGSPRPKTWRPHFSWPSPRITLQR